MAAWPSRTWAFDSANRLPAASSQSARLTCRDLIDSNWADILRLAATMAAAAMRPSQILRQLAADPRQNELAATLREVGRVERSLFMMDGTTDPGLRRRVQVGLNKGEPHHALKRTIHLHQRGELRDRTGQGQHYRGTGLNLLAAIIIYWNTLKLDHAVFARRKAGSRNPGRVPGPRLAPGRGTHQPDRRVPLAKHPIHGPRETLNVGFRPLPQTTPYCRWLWAVRVRWSTVWTAYRTTLQVLRVQFKARNASDGFLGGFFER